MIRLKLLIKGLITNIVFTTILFICAGKINYYQGWIFLSVNILTTFMNALFLDKHSDLAKERAKIGEGTKSWDKLILGLSSLIYLIIIVIAGLDSGRFLWTSQFSWNTIILGFLIMMIGQIIFLTARSQNNFFSNVVRIQKDRGQTVCDTGLYKIIRHPGYLGMILSLVSIPLITTSFWSTIPTVIAIILILIRTSLEDKTLKNELEGYLEYSKKTKYKLIPFVW